MITILSDKKKINVEMKTTLYAAQTDKNIEQLVMGDKKIKDPCETPLLAKESDRLIHPKKILNTLDCYAWFGICSSSV